MFEDPTGCRTLGRAITLPPERDHGHSQRPTSVQPSPSSARTPDRPGGLLREGLEVGGRVFKAGPVRPAGSWPLAISCRIRKLIV